MAENKSKKRVAPADFIDDNNRPPVKIPLKEQQESRMLNNRKGDDKEKPAILEEAELSWSFRDFLVREMLGSGGFASVYRVVDKRNGSQYALKHQSLAVNGLDAVTREVDIHSRMNHPNVVKIHGSFKRPLSFYMVLEYCENGNLYEVMTKRGCPRLTMLRVKAYTRQIIDALVYLHTNVGYLHMDLKPENLLVTSEDVIKISDFGCAVRMKGLRMVMTKNNGGTATYRPPEMIREEGYDSTVDVWSLGCVVYEMIFRRHPFFPLLWKKNFVYNKEEKKNSLLLMEQAEKEGLFLRGPRISPAVKSFLEMILSAPRCRRPLITEMKKVEWLMK